MSSKICIVLAAILLNLSAAASSVLWNAVTVESGEYQEIHLVTGGDVQFYSMFGVQTSVSGTGVTLTANPNGYHMLSFKGGWLSALAGDLVCSSTMSGLSSYFVDGIVGQDMVAEASVVAKYGESNFMKFAVQDSNDCYDYMDGILVDAPVCYYGWLEYTVSDAGVISVVRSAIGMDRQDMIVGAVPEPAGGLLVLLGLGVLGLRRKR